MLGPRRRVVSVDHVKGCAYRITLECGHDFVRESTQDRLPKHAHCKPCGYKAQLEAALTSRRQEQR